MSFDHWDELLSSVQVEDGPVAEALIETLQRIQWRLIKREQRYRFRTVSVDLVTIPTSYLGLDEAEWRVVISQLPSIEANVVTLVIVQGYTEGETGMILGFSQSYIHKVKEKAISDLEVLLS
ncbi:MAG: RNA polymerase sigma factor sigma-70 region 4 domain-containing protein [Bacilli bacterium]